MTIRFAAAKRPCPVNAIRFIPSAIPLAVNDNGLASANDQIIQEALRHFAQHGLRAAERAREYALIAQNENDKASFDRWVSICRTLDRRMGEALSLSSAS